MLLKSRPAPKAASYQNNNQQGVCLSSVTPTYNAALPVGVQATYEFAVQESNAFTSWFVLCRQNLPAAPGFQVLA